MSVVSDLHLPPQLEDISEGLAIIEAARELRSAGPGSRDHRHRIDKSAAREAVKRGAYGFFEKPLDAAEVLHIVNQAARMRRLEVENARLRDELVGARRVWSFDWFKSGAGENAEASARGCRHQCDRFDHR